LESQVGRTTEKGLFGTKVVEPTALEAASIDEVLNIKGVKKGNSANTNYNIIEQAKDREAKLLNDNLDEKIFKNWRESIINDEKGRIGDFDKLAQRVDHFCSNLTIEHLTLFKQIIIDFKPKLDEFVKTVNCEVAEKRKIAHEIFDNIAGKIE
jgi:hypothetical protein